MGKVSVVQNTEVVIDIHSTHKTVTSLPPRVRKDGLRSLCNEDVRNEFERNPDPAQVDTNLTNLNCNGMRNFTR